MPDLKFSSDIGRFELRRAAERPGEGSAVVLLFSSVPSVPSVPSVEVLESFEREGPLLRQLAHPAIPKYVSTLRVGSGVNTWVYTGQEHIEGTPLDTVLEHHRFTEREARELCRQLLEILVYLHGLRPRVSHRDIKPANVILRSGGKVSLVDFGTARDLTGDVTHGSTLVGMVGYMPRQWCTAGQPVARSTDRCWHRALHVPDRSGHECKARGLCVPSDVRRVGVIFNGAQKAVVVVQNQCADKAAPEEIAVCVAPRPGTTNSPTCFEIWSRVSTRAAVDAACLTCRARRRARGGLHRLRPAAPPCRR